MVVCLLEGWEVRGEDCIDNCDYCREAGKNCKPPGLSLVSMVVSEPIRGDTYIEMNPVHSIARHPKYNDRKNDLRTAECNDPLRDLDDLRCHIRGLR
jgi:hypothetical protein